jgi:hypothetical protein
MKSVQGKMEAILARIISTERWAPQDEIDAVYALKIRRELIRSIVWGLMGQLEGLKFRSEAEILDPDDMLCIIDKVKNDISYLENILIAWRENEK